MFAIGGIASHKMVSGEYGKINAFFVSPAENCPRDVMENFGVDCLKELDDKSLQLIVGKRAQLYVPRNFILGNFEIWSGMYIFAPKEYVFFESIVRNLIRYSGLIKERKLKVIEEGACNELEVESILDSYKHTLEDSMEFIENWKNQSLIKINQLAREARGLNREVSRV